jgi:tol-pal system protein YbgF
MGMARGLVSMFVLVAAFAAAGPAAAQKQSLGDRVTALEQKAAMQAQAGSQASVDQLNRLNQLQSEVASLRGLVEQLTNEVEQLKQRGRDQYVDIDTRLQRLEGGGATASPATPSRVPPPREGTESPVAPEPAAVAGPTNPPATPASPADEAAAYGAAFDSLRAGDYVASARGFHDFLEAYPNAALAPNAWYWLGESYYVTQNYELAAQSFDTVLRHFPDSNKASDALLKLGYSHLELGDRGEGERVLQMVIDRYPGSDNARLAENRLRSFELETR